MCGKIYDYFSCDICPRQCKADRSTYSGICKSGISPRVARAGLHYYEENCISGTKGSGAVFFTGCPMHCIYCQNEEISRGNAGTEISTQRLADIFKELENAGAENINLVTPTQWTFGIIEALDIYKPHIPVIYNCSGYERVETLRKLEGYIDVWLPDIKYADEETAKKFSGAADYPEVAFDAVAEMLRQSGTPKLDKNGMIRQGVIIRHLVLPSHIRESMKVLDTIKETFSTEIWISLMLQYTPMKAFEKYPELGRRLTKRECKKIENYLEEAGFENGYIQDINSSGQEYIPKFDNTGV